MSTQTGERGPTTDSHPGIAVGAAKRALPEEVVAKILSVQVDTSLHVPSMVEISFHDRDDDVLSASGLTIGTEVTVRAIATATEDTGTLIEAEVTAIEGVYDDARQIVVRGYTRDHRLQRRRSTRTFLNMTDSDIATKVARDAGLTIGTVTATRAAHDHVGQTNQTDWDFLRSRAARIGYEFGMNGKGFYFRPASAVSGSAVPLAYPAALLVFRPRVTAGNLAGSAELRSWDVAAAAATASVTTATAGSVELSKMTLATASAAFGPARAAPAPPAGGAGGGRSLGPQPSKNAHVVGSWPRGTASASAAADEMAAGIAEELGSSYAEAHGEALGDPRLVAGATVAVSGVGPTFSGKWTITRAVHEFAMGSYHTAVEFSGRQDRSLLGLTTGGPEVVPRIPGVVAGIVTNIADPDEQGRVKVALPWLSPTFETYWAPVAHAGSGEKTAALFPPDVGDEVLVAFEHGDPHRPFVLGGLTTSRSKYALGGAPVKRSGNTASVAWRGVVTPTGNRLAFHDETTPGGGSATASDLVLGTGGGEMALTIDQTAGTVSVKCDPKPPGSNAAQGTITIECGNAGAVNVRTGPGGKIDLAAGQGGSVTVDGGAQLTLKAAASVNIESQGPVVVKGNPIKLN